MPVVMPSSAEGSYRTSDSSRRRSGHRIMVMTVPSATSLKRPLAKLTAACLPNSRLAPESGEIFENFGLSCSPDQTRRCCIMLPAIAASASIKSGTPIAPITAMPRLLPSARRPGPSARTIQELAIRFLSGTIIPPPIEPEKVDRISVPPAITNQVLSSWLLTTSPRSSASSRRFWVGSSVLSSVSLSSAIFCLLPERHHLMHHADEVIEERSHHRRNHDAEDQEPCENRQRHADEIDLHLRHEARQHAEPDVEDEAEHQERRRQLQADPERSGKRPRRQRRDVAARHDFSWRKHHVAVVEGRDHQMMAVGRKQQRDAEHGEEIADQDALLSLGRIDRGDEAEPHLLGDDR